MSEHEEKQPLEESTPIAAVEPSAETPKPVVTHSLATKLAMMALAGVIILPVASYFYFDHVNKELYFLARNQQEATDQRKEQDKVLELLKQNQGAFFAKLEAQEQRFSLQQQELQQERDHYFKIQQETLGAVNALQRRIGRSTSRWMAAEAEYLIRVAGHRLQLESDVETALSALQSADERLRDSADPVWIPVRALLAEDIAQLKTVAPFDRSGLSARLSGMAAQVAKLKVRSTLLNNPKNAEPSGEIGSGFSWRQLLQDGWQGFSKLMVVRRNDQPVAAMLPPEQRFFLGQNLKLQIESARLALLRADQPLFDGSVMTAVAWLGEYFEPEDPVTKSLAQSLAELAQLKVKPELPDISGALTVLRNKSETIDQASQISQTNGDAKPLLPEATHFEAPSSPGTSAANSTRPTLPASKEGN